MESAGVQMAAGQHPEVVATHPLPQQATKRLSDHWSGKDVANNNASGAAASRMEPWWPPPVLQSSWPVRQAGCVAKLELERVPGRLP